MNRVPGAPDCNERPAAAARGRVSPRPPSRGRVRGKEAPRVLDEVYAAGIHREGWAAPLFPSWPAPSDPPWTPLALQSSSTPTECPTTRGDPQLVASLRSAAATPPWTPRLRRRLFAAGGRTGRSGRPPG